MLITIIQIILIICVPLLIINFRNNKLTKLIGSIGMAYLLGIIFSLVIYLLNLTHLEIAVNKDIGEIVSHVAIGISIPLLLFSSNLKSMRKLSKKLMISFFSVVCSVIIVSVSVFFIYSRNIEYGAELSAMAVGLYTGGTSNLNAIGSILGVDSNVIAFSNLSDMIIGAIFYIFLLLACKPIFKHFLKKNCDESYTKEKIEAVNYDDISEKINILKNKKLWLNILYAFLMAAFGAVIGLVVWLISGAKEGRMIDNLVPFMMITVTICGIIASFNKKISEVKGNNLIGQYLILVFSFSLACSMDFNELSANFLNILIVFVTITIGSFIINLIFSKIFKVDVDCMMVMITAGLYGPAFVPAITNQIDNDELTAPGLVCGSIGYAIGTFLGVAICFVLKLFI